MSAITAATLVGITAGVALHEDAGSVRRISPRLVSANGVVAVSRAPSTAPGAIAVPCGAASTATIAGVDGVVAQLIYKAELHSREVSADIAHIMGSRELVNAVASANGSAAYAAVHTIVYTPRWHIVRLRVVRNGRVLADVGGPDIIAPVSGPLRLNGRVVGSFVMSVQDDLGYVKLVSRFIGVPIDLYRNGSLVMGTLQPAPPLVRTGAPVTVAGRKYQAHVLDALAFPSGALRVALFVPEPTSAVTGQSCAAVRVAAWGSVAKHIAARFNPLAAHYRELVETLRGSTGGLAYVRAGSSRLAGGVGPARIPHGGTVSYRGRSWSVFSWEPVPPARIYLLTPAA